jgi:hypothetical protein
MNKKERKELKEFAQEIIQSGLLQQFMNFSDKAFLAALHNDFKKELLYLMLAMETAEKMIDDRAFL